MLKINFLGNIHTHTLEQRLYIIATFFAVIGCTVGLITFLVSDTPLIVSVVVFWVDVLFFSFYYLARIKRKPLLFKPILLLMSFLAISLGWFFSDGLYGTAPFYFFMGTMVFLFLFRSSYYWILFFIVISAVGLICVQVYFPALIVPYTSEEIRFFDFTFTLILGLAVIGFISIFLKQTMDSERRIIEKQKEEIEAQRHKLQQSNTMVSEAYAKIQEQNQALHSHLEELTMLKNESEEAHEKVEKLLKNTTDSINYARRIQYAIIPKESDLQKHFECFVFFRPRDIVSGDFYWFADKGNIKIVAVMDCTGHGVSGAFMTMIGNNILNLIIHDHEIHEPQLILDLMSPLLQKTLLHSEGKVRDGMDIAILSIESENLQTKKAKYAGAKLPLYYVQQNQFNEIKPDRYSIGATIEIPFLYKQTEILIHVTQETSKTTFYLFTDGYRDQFGGEHHRKLMSVNFKNLLCLMAGLPMAEQKQIVEKNFDDWKGTHAQTDDVLVLGIQISS